MRLLRRIARLWFNLLVMTTALLGLALAVRVVMPYLPLPHPFVEATVPAAGADEVLPRTRLTMQFSQPMNRTSVVQALQLDPTFPYEPIWSDGGRTLIISPTVALAPNTSYRLSVGPEAIGWLFQPIDQPLSLAFRTTPAPTVVNLLPADQSVGVSPAALLSIGFSRPMVPSELVGRDLTIAELQIEPPVERIAQWLDQTTLLLRPLPSLAPATIYTVTVNANLRDLAGSSLGQPLIWRFHTEQPQVRAIAPPNNARSVGLRQSLVISLTQPIDLPTLQASLVISPAVSGHLISAAPDAASGVSQVVSFVPDGGWQPTSSYTVTVPAGLPPAQGTLPLTTEVRWSFRTADLPRVIGRFPGEDQPLPPSQDLRLVLSTPFDPATVAAALSFDPPADALNVRGSGNEIRISAAWRPSTAYTATLLASLTDTSGVALGRDYQLRFVTASAAPSLSLPAANRRILTLPTAEDQRLRIEHINLRTLNLSLYDLDQATLVRALNFSEQEWQGFTPERYGRSELRQLVLPLSSPLDELAVSEVNASLLNDQLRLAPGAYYLRITSPEGPRADLLLIVANTALALKQNADRVVVWAVDSSSRTPVADLALALYQGDTIIARGRSDAAGIWRIPYQRNADSQSYIVVSDQLSVVSSDWRLASDGLAAQQARQTPPTYQGLLYSDRLAYQPGDNVLLGALVRRVNDALPAWPAGEPIELIVRPVGAPAIYQRRLMLTDGVVTDTFRLPDDAPQGRYLLQGKLGSISLEARFNVERPSVPPLRLTLDLPSQATIGEVVPISARVTTPQGLPLSGVNMRWRLTLVVPSDSTLAVPTALEGSGLSDADGVVRAEIALPAEVGGRYRLDLTAEELPGISANTTDEILVVPALSLKPSLSSAMIRSGDEIEVTVLAYDNTGQPVVGVALEVEMRRQIDPQSDEPVLRRRITTGDDGSAAAQLPGQLAGQYRVIVRAPGVAGASVTLPLTLYREGFTAWPILPGTIPLLTDQPSYQPGDVATLLPLLPFESGSVLLVRERPGILDAQVLNLQAGVPITLSVSEADLPGLYLSLLTLTPTDGAPATFLSGYTLLPVRAAAPLLVAVQPDRDRYLPGQTATFTVSVRDAAGMPVEAAIALIATTGQLGLSANAVDQTFGILRSPGVVTAAGLARQPSPTPTRRDQASDVAMAEARSARSATVPAQTWVRELRSGPDGLARVELRMPDTPAQVEVALLARSDAVRLAETTLTLPVDYPVKVEPVLPTRLSVGDEAELAVRVTNTDALSREVAITLAAGGVVPRSGSPLTQRVTLEAGATTVVRWIASAGVGPEASIGFSVQLSDGTVVVVQRALAVQPAVPYAEQRGGGPAVPRFAASAISLPGVPASGALELVVAPSVQAALLQRWQELERIQPRSVTLEAETLLAGQALVRASLLPSDTLTAPLRRLLEAQAADGGWGWWPASPSDPLISAQAAVALATAPEGVATVATERTATYLRLALEQNLTDHNLRAWLLYGLAALGEEAPDIARDLTARSEQLQNTALAALVLALEQTGDETAAAQLAVELAARAQLNADQAVWSTSPEERPAPNPVAATALAVQALAAVSPDSPQFEQGRRALLQSYTPAGWDNGMADSFVIAALAAPLPLRAEEYQYIVAVNGIELPPVTVSNTLTATQSTTISAGDLRAANDLTVTRSGEAGTLLVGYRLRVPVALPPAGGNIAIQRMLLDPNTSAPLDPTALRNGQIVKVRLTLVLPRNQHFIALNDPLPACLDALAPTYGPSPFEAASIADQHLRAYAAALPAGVYEHHYLARVGTPGNFSGLPPQISLVYDPSRSGQGSATRLIVR